MSKTPPTEKIRNIVCGNKDPFGYKIENVLARGNEYAIYEADVADINNRIRVLIDGINDESEKALIDKYNKVKPKYIEAKGLLYGSTNYGMMKLRVANVLAGVLSSEESDIETWNKEFDTLIKTLIKENDEYIRKRTYYLGPCAAVSFVFFCLAATRMELRTTSTPEWQIITALFASSIGGSMSMLYNAKKLDFDQYNSKMFYFMLGCERLFLAVVAGAIAFILIKAKFILPGIIDKTYWGMMAILVVAAFSESLVPSALARIEKEVENQKKPGEKPAAPNKTKAPKTAPQKNK